MNLIVMNRIGGDDRVEQELQWTSLPYITASSISITVTKPRTWSGNAKHVRVEEMARRQARMRMGGWRLLARLCVLHTPSCVKTWD